MILVQKILFLKKVPLFSSMVPSELSQLASIAEEVVVPAGSEIIHQEDHGDSMFVIVEGEIRIHQDQSDLACLKSQDYFGEMSILDGEPRSASATAQTDSLLLRIKQEDFYFILSKHFEVALNIIQTLTRRLRRVSLPQSLIEKNSDEKK